MNRFIKLLVASHYPGWASVLFKRMQRSRFFCLRLEKQKLFGVLSTLVSDSGIFCTSWSLTQGSSVHHRVWLRDVLYITESDSGMFCTSRSLTQGFSVHHGVWLRDVLYITESDSGMFCTSQSLTQGCSVHHWVWLSGTMHSAHLESLI